VDRQSVALGQRKDLLEDKVANSTSPVIQKSYTENKFAKLLNKRFLCYISYIQSTLTIYNDAPAYTSMITVYVCIPHMYKNCNDRFSSMEISGLYQSVVGETQLPQIRSMKPGQILWSEDSQNKNYKSWPFKLSLGVEPGANLENSQAIHR